jgi:hypothetical protein
VVISSATPSTAATISQTIHAMAAPQRNFRAASWRRNAVGARETLVPWLQM